MYPSRMCGRYALHANAEVVALQFALSEQPSFRESYNLRPGNDVLVVRRQQAGERVAAPYRWGLVPHWAKSAAIGNQLANARAEGIEEKPAFRDAFQWRCLVPASGYYEWRSAAGRKQPWYMQPVDAPLFGLAGITALWHGLRSVALITTVPNALTETIHERMPLIIALEDYAAWLDPQNAGAKALLRSYPAARMRSHPVSERVNSPDEDDAGLVAQAAPRQRDLLEGG